MFVDIPTRPEIVNATIFKDVLWIKWNVADDGGSNIENVILEWSNDFNNKSAPIGRKGIFVRKTRDYVSFRNSVYLIMLF